MLYQPQNAEIVYSLNDLPNAWCVYEHRLHKPGGEPSEVIFVSWCKLNEVYNLTYAARNSEWKKLSATPGVFIYVKIIATGTESDCRNAAVRHMRTFDPMPICNLKGVDTTLVSRRIGCSNGKEYESQTDAATQLGIPQGMISRHLNAGPNHVKHVKGLTFWRL